MPTKPGKKLNLINVRVDDETRDELRRLAAKAHRPVSNYVAAVLLEHIAAEQAKEKPAG